MMADLRRAGTAARRHRDHGERRRIPGPAASRRVGVLPRWLLATRRAVVHFLRVFLQRRVHLCKTECVCVGGGGTSTCERAFIVKRRWMDSCNLCCCEEVCLSLNSMTAVKQTAIKTAAWGRKKNDVPLLAADMTAINRAECLLQHSRR